MSMFCNNNVSTPECPMNANVVDVHIPASTTRNGIYINNGYGFQKSASGNFDSPETMTMSAGADIYPKPKTVEQEQRNPWGPYRCRDSNECSGSRQCYIWNNDIAGTCVNSCSPRPFAKNVMNSGPYNLAPPMARYNINTTGVDMAALSCVLPEY